VNQTIKYLESFKRSHPSKFSDPNNVDFFSAYIHLAGGGLLKGALFSVGS